jgi:hypothetical protein
MWILGKTSSKFPRNLQLATILGRTTNFASSRYKYNLVTRDFSANALIRNASLEVVQR